MHRKLVILLVLALLPSIALAQLTESGKVVDTVTSTDIVGLTYWTSDTIRVLDGFVYVENGEKLIIDAGTIIKALPGQAGEASALIVARGGQLFAEGTQCHPIIFTSVDDNLDDPYDIPLPPDPAGRALWGGVLLLGRAQINDPSGENSIEGLPETDDRNKYGGTNDDDCSGILKYVSIRHGGSKFGDANEINGLTLGAVGRGTIIDYVEIFANLDDGIEFFGGAPEVKHIVVGFVGDDDFDYDEGFRGAAQFVFAIKDTSDSDQSGEHDGGGQGEGVPEDVTPYATPCLSNVTYIGAAANGNSANADGGFDIRDNAGGAYFNSIIANQNGPAFKGVEDLPPASGADSRERLSVGDLYFQNNLFWAVTQLHNPAHTWVADSIFGDGSAGKPDRDNDLDDPELAGLNWGAFTNLLDPVPSTTGPAATRIWVEPTSVYQPVSNWPGFVDWTGFFEPVDYLGAFAPGEELWVNNWTALSHYGFLPEPVAQTGEEWTCCVACQSDNNKLEITENEFTIDGFTVWNRENVHVMNGFVYVEDGDTLLIEPGTIIKSPPGQAGEATALIVARGGLIYALGSPTCPVVFTSSSDDTDDRFDIPLPPDPAGRALWGGVVILGRATINDPSGVNWIEGLPQTDSRNQYGGTDDADNSGALKYISIRHGGSKFGDANEINGLTLGAVGYNTIIDGVEIFANLDDGIEFFGGMPMVKHVVIAFVGDDDFDYDEGFRGRAQFVFGIKDTVDSDQSGEHDGGGQGEGVPDDVEPYALPLISNVTYFGAAPNGNSANANGTFNIRDNAGGGYFNSIFAEQNGAGIKNIEDLASGHDSRERLSVGDLHFENNIFWNLQGPLHTAAQTWVADSIFGDGSAGKPNYANRSEDPVYGCVNWLPACELDPVPDTNGPAVGTWVNPLTNYNPQNALPGWNTVRTDFFEEVEYIGAFQPRNPEAAWTCWPPLELPCHTPQTSEPWPLYWTFLHTGGWLGHCRVEETCDCGMKGDVNNDGGTTPLDVQFLVKFVYKSQDALYDYPNCPWLKGDVNCDGGTTPLDVQFLVKYVYKSQDALCVQCP
jgi:hypothetical protein